MIAIRDTVWGPGQALDDSFHGLLAPLVVRISGDANLLNGENSNEDSGKSNHHQWNTDQGTYDCHREQYPTADQRHSTKEAQRECDQHRPAPQLPLHMLAIWTPTSVGSDVMATRWTDELFGLIVCINRDDFIAIHTIGLSLYGADIVRFV